MTANITGLLPSVTSSIVNKVLFLEVYFLLKAGQSPAYFSLIEFVWITTQLSYGYIPAVFFSMFAGWLIRSLHFGGYQVINVPQTYPGAISYWLGRLNLIRAC